MTERQTAILDETLVGEVLAANRTVEAVRMVAAIDRLYHTSVDPLLANRAAWREQDLKIVLAVLATLELIELDVLVEWSKAL